jgi:hypothetical protein
MQRISLEVSECKGGPALLSQVLLTPCHISGDQVPPFHRGDPGSILGHVGFVHSGTTVGFLRVLRLSLPIFVPRIAPSPVQ